MKIPLKPLSRQVVVITGASSGIGLVTARMAAARGARIVLAARHATALQEIARQIERGGGQAEPVVADVGSHADARRIAERAIARFGGFDTWINNAGVAVYGSIQDVPLEDHCRLFQTNFWGTAHGCLAALPHLRQRGGALINVASELSDHGMPLMGMYAASKHAVKGFTDSLRMELRQVREPVSVTLVKPAGIDSALLRHARTLMGVPARLPPPIYAPEVAARAILAAAEKPMHDVFVGSSAKLSSLRARVMPRLFHAGLRAPMHRRCAGADRRRPWPATSTSPASGCTKVAVPPGWGP